MHYPITYELWAKIISLKSKKKKSKISGKLWKADHTFISMIGKPTHEIKVNVGLFKSAWLDKMRAMIINYWLVNVRDQIDS